VTPVLIDPAPDKRSNRPYGFSDDLTFPVTTYQAVGGGVGVNSPAMASDSTSETLNFDKEQRRERLQWVFYGVSSMLFVVCGFYVQERIEVRILHAYGLTVLTYGALIYVEEFQHLKRLWLWKSVLATIPLHSVFLAGLFWWDAQAPESSGFILAYRILPFFVAEMVIFSSVIDYFKASASPDEPPRKLTRLLPWQNKPKAKWKESSHWGVKVETTLTPQENRGGTIYDGSSGALAQF
jgi:hypothetical protein